MLLESELRNTSVRALRFFAYLFKSGKFLLLILACVLTGCGTTIEVPNVRTVAQVIAPTKGGCEDNLPGVPGTSTNAMLFSGGLQRFYRLHLPLGYRNTIRHALVMNFHGHGGSAQIQEHLSGMSNLADKEGFVVVYPQGTIGPDHRTGWNTGPRTYPHVNDVLFVRDLITHLEDTLCIEPHRVYAAGFSNGGSLANVLACKLSDRIAAFAIASGGMHPVEGGCHPQKPASILEFHGTADQIVPYTGNSANDSEPPIEDWLADWVQRSGCNPEASIFFYRYGVLGEQWTNCRNQAVIVHYRITGGQHVWPQGGFTNATGKEYSNATDLIYQFFQEHAL